MSSEQGQTPPANSNGTNYDEPRRYAMLAALIGLGAFVLFGALRLTVMGSESPSQFFLAYLVGFVFWISFPIGSMALLKIQYLTKGRWGILTRRTFEAHSRCLALMVLLFIPVLIGVYWQGSPLYWWSGDVTTMTDVPEAQHELQEKQERFLNPTFYLVGSIGYFAFWGLMAYLLNSWARKSDLDPDAKERYWLKNISGPGLILQGLVMTFAATHWVMSLEPNWASTMFPVIYGINQLLSAWALGVIVVLYLARRSPMKEVVQPIDKINLGSFLLALTLFWTYISFSQFMLIWVANLPEEIPFYLKRIRGGWRWIGIALAVFHFAMPLLLLLYRDIKLHPRRLQAVAVGLLVMCAFDVFWWIEPVVSHEGHPLFWLLDIAALVGIGGVYLWYFFGQLPTGDALLPTHEKYLLEEGHHEH